MEILFFCPRWGQSHTPWNAFLQRVKDAGYDGTETDLPLDDNEKQLILDEINRAGLLLIGQHWQTVDANFDVHKQQFERHLRSLAAAKPLFINSQTGKDFFSFDNNVQLIRLADKIAQETGVEILHETHRGKFSFAAHITQPFLRALPGLKITLDISHWVTTAETYLHDQTAAVDLAIERTAHIHSRVGYIEGPQITDPRAPEWNEAVDYHLSVWDKVVAIHKSNGREQLTITPEFGAPPYLPLLPYTRQPIVDQWEVNVYMMNLLRERYRG